MLHNGIDERRVGWPRRVSSSFEQVRSDRSDSAASRGSFDENSKTAGLSPAVFFLLRRVHPKGLSAQPDGRKESPGGRDLSLTTAVGFLPPLQNKLPNH